MKENCSIFKEELIQKAWSPIRIAKWLNDNPDIDLDNL